jgi:hydroxymethylpyrimidine/phosphomethylpyrimidine kinase
LLKSEAVFALTELLFPLACVITPNLPEAEVLCGHPIASEVDMIQAAKEISRIAGGSAILIKGGHLRGCLASQNASAGANAASAVATAIAEAGAGADVGTTCGRPPIGAGATAGAGVGANDSPLLSKDLLYCDDQLQWYCSDYIKTINTHGTGCTLSSAIASGLASGLSLADAVGEAKRYVSAALASQINLGKGTGPINHLVRV